jgi:chromosomal replication initiator protein
MVTSEHIWLRVTKRIQSKLPTGEFRTWFSRATLKTLEGDSAVISVPNRFYALWMAEKYLPAIEECFAKTVKGALKVSFCYEQSAEESGEDPEGMNPGLDPSLTFDELQKGKWNRFACSSSLRVTEKPSRAYNPLYLFSGPGLGKTHLLHAVGNRIRFESPDASVRIVPCMTFVSECSRYSGKDQYQSVEERFSSLDVLLFDDVHLLQQRPDMQESLVSLFDFLYSRDKRMLFSADRPPQELKEISKPLRSRLGWGVLAEIGMPDHNGLTGIIRKMGKENGVHLPADVVFFLSHSSRDIKALKKNIMKLKSYALLKGGQINISVAKSLIKGSDQSRIGIKDIQSVTAGYFNIPIHDLTTGSKKRSHSYPRQVAMYLARKYTDLSFKEIGGFFGNKDHSTVIHAIRKIEQQRDRSRSTTDDLTRIENLIS